MPKVCFQLKYVFLEIFTLVCTNGALNNQDDFMHHLIFLFYFHHIKYESLVPKQTGQVEL